MPQLREADVELVLSVGPHLDRVRTLRVQGHGEQYAGERGELGQHDAKDAAYQGMSFPPVRLARITMKKPDTSSASGDRMVGAFQVFFEVCIFIFLALCA